MAEYDRDNVFAKILRGELPAHKVYEDEHTLAFMDVFPHTPGHTLVIPKAPSRNMLEADAEDLCRVMRTLQKVARAVKEAMKADGIRIMQLNEAPAGQEVFHTHFHIIPAYEGVRPKRPGDMAPAEELAATAEKIRTALA